MQPALRTSTVAAARLAIVCSIAAFILLLSLHLLSPEYSLAWRMVSEHADGQYGWVLSLMFAAYGLGELALAVALCARSVSRLGLVFLSLSGVGATSAAVFDLSRPALHDAAGVIGIVCLSDTPLQSSSPEGFTARVRDCAPDAARSSALRDSRAFPFLAACTNIWRLVWFSWR
jgi:hypothetical protein